MSKTTRWIMTLIPVHFVELCLRTFKPAPWCVDTVTTKTVEFTISTQLFTKYPLPYVPRPLSRCSFLVSLKWRLCIYHPLLLQSCLTCIYYIWYQHHLALNALILIKGWGGGGPNFNLCPKTACTDQEFCPFSQISCSGLIQIGPLQSPCTTFS